MKQEIQCKHDFRYSHIESPPSGDYSAIPPDKEVVVCRKCGEIRKTIVCGEAVKYKLKQDENNKITN